MGTSKVNSSRKTALQRERDSKINVTMPAGHTLPLTFAFDFTASYFRIHQWFRNRNRWFLSGSGSGSGSDLNLVVPPVPVPGPVPFPHPWFSDINVFTRLLSQHMQSLWGGILVISSVQIYRRICRWKCFVNRLRFNRINDHGVFAASHFWPTLYRRKKHSQPVGLLHVSIITRRLMLALASIVRHSAS